MAVQTYPFLKITDGTTEVTIQDGSGGATNYPLVDEGWAPAIAGLRTSPLAGVTPYDDVVETLRIEVNGATAAEALANLATLQKLLEQAARWYRGENETAVLLKFAPAGSTVSSTAAPLQAAILGGGAAGDMGLQLTPKWSDVSFNYVISGVVLTLTRRGLWLHTTIETPATNAGNNGELVTTTFAAASGLPAPTEIWASNYQHGIDGSSRANGGFLLVGENVGGSAPMAIVNAEGGTATDYTSVAGGKNARNTNVLRYTPTATGERQSGLFSPTLPTATDLVAVFANVFPSTTVSFTMRIFAGSKLEFVSGPTVAIPAQSAFANYPYWVFLGVVPKSGASFNFYLYTAASAASSSLDIDTFVVCDARAVQVLGLGGVELANTYTSDTLKVDHNLLDLISPSALVDSRPITRLGDAVFMTKATTVITLLLATGGGTGNAGQEYRQANIGTDAVLSNTWTLKRAPAYLVPQ